jgi:hypothetical protein
MNAVAGYLGGRRSTTNWLERGISAWVNDVRDYCDDSVGRPISGYADLTAAYCEPARIYFALAARSRAKTCPPSEREMIYRHLFVVRTCLERAIYRSIANNRKAFEGHLFDRGFFGGSIKQGISVRFPLFSCVPTRKCAGGCYAHDGRDKHFTAIVRGVLNYVTIEWLQRSTEHQDAEAMRRFQSQIDRAIVLAKREAAEASAAGFSRRPRIRLSHVGEIASIPEMANWLGHQIKARSSGGVDAIIYTRHPKAIDLDTNALVVNFTIESNHYSRKKYAPEGSRLVASSWGGAVLGIAEVNFLEHHGEAHSVRSGAGKICPVTLDHASTPTCDSAKCTICFRQPCDIGL